MLSLFRHLTPCAASLASHHPTPVSWCLIPTDQMNRQHLTSTVGTSEGKTHVRGFGDGSDVSRGGIVNILVEASCQAGGLEDDQRGGL